MSHAAPKLAAIAVAFALALPQPALAADGVPPIAVHVTVLPDRYVAAGKPFADLAGLEAWARPIVIRTLWLDSCGPAATKPLLAAVERLHDAYPEGVLIRTLARTAPGCVDAVAEIDAGYNAVDLQGRSWMP